MGDVKVKEAWSEVGAQVSGLGERLKGHFSHSGETTEATADVADAGRPSVMRSTAAPPLSRRVRARRRIRVRPTRVPPTR